MYFYCKYTSVFGSKNKTFYKRDHKLKDLDTDFSILDDEM